MTPTAFVAKWTGVQLSERAASQEHFIDLCRMLGQPTPAEHDQTGSEISFPGALSVSLLNLVGDRIILCDTCPCPTTAT